MIYDKFSLLDFGKHEGLPLWVVYVCYPDYIDWCIRKVEAFAVESLDDLTQNKSFGPQYPSGPAWSFEDCVDEELYWQMVKDPNHGYDRRPREKQEHLLARKGYEWFVKSYEPFMKLKYEFSEEAREMNEAELSEQNEWPHLRAREPSEERPSYSKYGGAYDLDDDTIEDAFEGDPENYWNID